MDAKYFIKKFRSIPEALWTTGDIYNGWTYQHCALGFCDNTERRPLQFLFIDAGLSPAMVNDGYSSFRQSTPKARILAALKHIQANYEN